MIEAAGILSAVARHWPDFAIILLLLLANALVGFWDEHQAGRFPVTTSRPISEKENMFYVSVTDPFPGPLHPFSSLFLPPAVMGRHA
jgi:hypothetical protein